jgi:hypothetical protein
MLANALRTVYDKYINYQRGRVVIVDQLLKMKGAFAGI